MELTPIYSQLPIDVPKHDASVSKSKSPVIVEGYSVFAYRVRDNGGEYSTSNKVDSSDGACNSDKQQLVNSKNATTYSKKRKWGEGNGYIEWRTITKNGKDYNQAYYHWKENGNKYSRYIPKKLLGVIQEADKQKRPVTEILDLLGVVRIQFVASENEEKHPLDYISTPTLTPTSHSQTRRHKGDGSGYIQWKPITVNGKKYSQPWYHYEFWNHQERVIKSSRYIPKQLLTQVIQLDADKVPVQQILNLLGYQQ